MAGNTLKTYQKMRDFKSTPEPRGSPAKAGRVPIFVIQQHDASRLHYDLRLEVEGVLKSWAVPKGPSADPKIKRLAIPTEDHPIDYANFEGVIPEEQYGAGAVMVWDAGTYANTKAEIHGHQMSMKTGIERGEITFRLNGKKVKGGYVLIRIKKVPEEIWLLIKRKDEEARTGRTPSSREKARSVLSGLTLDEIREAAK